MLFYAGGMMVAMFETAGPFGHDSGKLAASLRFRIGEIPVRLVMWRQHPLRLCWGSPGVAGQQRITAR